MSRGGRGGFRGGRGGRGRGGGVKGATWTEDKDVEPDFTPSALFPVSPTNSFPFITLPIMQSHDLWLTT